MCISGIRSGIMLMVALCFHSFLAGLAFGSQPDPGEEFKVNQRFHEILIQFNYNKYTAKDVRKKHLKAPDMFIQ